MTARKAGALAILVPIITGAIVIWSGIVSGVTKWNFVETKVKEHEEKLLDVHNLYRLNCMMAIEVIKDKNTLREFCSGVN